MQVFKFGGASVKDAAGVRNLASILQHFQHESVVVVISAMGKTTNALEEVVKSYFFKRDDLSEKLEVVRRYHTSLVTELVEQPQEILEIIEDKISGITHYFSSVAAGTPFDEIYDQVVSVGELLSTKIVSYYLNSQGTSNNWVDAREVLRTSRPFREGRIDWETTKLACLQHFSGNQLSVTQGFIGQTADGKTTTLGREGSDYSASIIAYCLGASAVTIWKDVDGVLSADPRIFSTYEKFDQLSYQEAIEMTYYGATVIHPKTIKPLQNAEIPLYVKPFLKPTASGTVINKDDFRQKHISAIIVKKNQVLISLSSKDFSFFSEADMSTIFNLFAQHQMKCHVTQNSALSFTVCTDWDDMKFEPLKQALEKFYKVRYNDGLTLYTIRHYTDTVLDNLLKDKTIYLEQYSRSTAQFVSN